MINNNYFFIQEQCNKTENYILDRILQVEAHNYEKRYSSKGFVITQSLKTKLLYNSTFLHYKECHPAVGSFTILYYMF